MGARRRLLLIRPAVSLPVATKFKTPSDGHVYSQQRDVGDGHSYGRAATTFDFRFRLTDKVATRNWVRHCIEAL